MPTVSRAVDALVHRGLIVRAEDAEDRRTGGTVFGINCPGCGVVLKDYGRGRWPEGDPAAVRWHTDGDRWLVGGDRWRGRPGAWSPDDATRHESRLRGLREQVGSLEEAVRVLHTTAGLGALHIAGLVERVAGLPTEEAKRLVIRALAPDWEE